MKIFYESGAMFAEVDYIKVIKNSVKLGNILLRPGMLVNRIGEKSSTFEMKENYFLEYIGKSIEDQGTNLLFYPYPAKERIKKIDTYYCFTYIDRNNLLVDDEGKGWMVKVEKVEHMKIF